MSIINEMRAEVDRMWKSGESTTLADKIDAWADTLERLNPLMKVPVGNLCLLRHVDGGHVLADDGHIYHRGEHGNWWSMKDPFKFLIGVDMFVQPVRLVPLVPLAELGKESEG